MKRLLSKKYTIDITKLGWRLADLSIGVENGRARKTAAELFSNNRNNIIVATLRIGDPTVDIMATIFYRDSQELHSLIESVKEMNNVTHVEWSEVIETTESNLLHMLDRVFRPVLRKVMVPSGFRP